MASIKTKLTVGVFVLIGFGLALVAILWLGMASQFEKGQFYAAYFDESVQGLNKDSPVKYRGVTIGRVDRIAVAPDTRLIEVVLKIESGLKPGPEMVAELKAVGITGIVFVELDRKRPGSPDPSPRLEFESKYPVVATRPSDISKIIASVDSILNQIQSMDLPALSARTRHLLEDSRRAVNDINLHMVSQDFRASLANWNRTMEAIDRASGAFVQVADRADRAVARIDTLLADNTAGLAEAVERINASLKRLDDILGSRSNPGGLAGAIADFQRAMAGTQRFVDRAGILLDDTDARMARVQRRLGPTLDHLERASIHLEQLLESVAERPSRLIFAAPPAPPEDEAE